MSKTFTLSKKKRLSSRKAIEALFEKGRRFTRPPFRVLYLLSPENGLRVGVTAGSKTFPSAAGRNRIRRLTREGWRLQKNELEQKLAALHKGLDVFLVFTGKTKPVYKEVETSVGQILGKLEKLIEKE